MKRIIFKIAFRLLITGIVLIGILIGLVLKPSILYANQTTIGNYTVYHNKPIEPKLSLRIDEAFKILQKSELYDQKIKFKICLNDGSIYPSLLQLFLGKAFALGFTSNKIAICGTMNCEENYVELNGYKWNLTHLISHEAAHCLVFNHLGFWNSNPVANHPRWKWEGYPEYVSRQDSNETNLKQNIELLTNTLRNDKDAWAVTLSDNTISPLEYLKYRAMHQYSFEVKKMNFNEMMKDTSSEETIYNEMMNWNFKQSMFEQH